MALLFQLDLMEREYMKSLYNMRHLTLLYVFTFVTELLCNSIPYFKPIIHKSNLPPLVSMCRVRMR